MSKKPSVAGGCSDSCLASSFVESGTGERGKERTLVYQAVSQYTPSRYVPIELLHLFTQMISLDISQRFVFVLPFNFFLISSKTTDTFYFPGFLFQLVPQNLKPFVRQGIGGFGGA
jgi:hypothetical protein